MKLPLLILLLPAVLVSAEYIQSEFETSHVLKNPHACSELYKLPTAEQCQFVKQNCSLPEDSAGLINYVKLYYCSLARHWALAVVSLSLVVSFFSLAHAASEFLCPNLYAISKLLALSDNLLGLTLLAFGNGSADIFSTYHALQTGSIGLATSELISAALFILTVVVGSISIAKPFKVPRFFFFRDTFFYLLISSLVLSILVYGAITYLTASAFIVCYVVYVAFAVYSHSYLSKLVRTLTNIAHVRSNYAWNPDEETSESDGEGPDFPSINQLTHNLDNEEEAIDDEFAEFLASHPHPTLEERIPIATGSYALKLLLKQLMKHSSGLIAKEPRSVTLSPELSPEPEVNSPQLGPPLRLGSSEYLLEQTEIVHRSLWRQLLPEIYPGQSLLLQLYLIITAPANILLKLTIPNRAACLLYCQKLESYNEVENLGMTVSDDEEEYDFTSDSILFRTQIVCSAIMLSIKIQEGIFLSVGIIAAAVALVFFTPSEGPKLQVNVKQHKAWNYFGSALGFCTSLMWVSVFASEIVTALKAAGSIFAVGDDKVGATLFAFGNSIGDLASNLSIARMGMPVMAFSACFGGPLLSICSLGLSATIIMAKTNRTSIPIHFSIVLKVTIFALISTLAFLVVFIPRNNWMFDKKVGAMLIAWWVVLMSTVLIF